MSIRRTIGGSRSVNDGMLGLLEEVNDYTIYCFFIGQEIGIKCLVKSPLRIDHNPTFNLFPARDPRWPGQILFKDYHYKTGNIFDFTIAWAAYHYNYRIGTIEDACTFIRSAMQLGIKQVHNIEPDIVENTEFYQVSTMKFNSEHLEFWTDLGVNKALLKTYNYEAAEYLFNSRNQIVKDLRRTMTFVYFIYDKFALYQPNQETFKKSKFFKQCPKEYVHGYQQCKMDFTGTLLITKSMKDVVVFQAHLPKWTDIIAPHGEGMSFDDNWLIWILMYKRIVIILDYDLTGVKGTQRLVRSLKRHRNYRGQEIIHKYISKDRILRGDKWVTPVKDSADFRLLYGGDASKELFSKLVYGTDERQGKKRKEGGCSRKSDIRPKSVEEGAPF